LGIEPRFATSTLWTCRRPVAIASITHGQEQIAERGRRAVVHPGLLADRLGCFPVPDRASAGATAERHGARADLPTALRGRPSAGASTRASTTSATSCALTGGIGPDVVIESAGAPGSWVYAASPVRRGGRVVVIGLSSTPSPVNVTQTLVAPEVELIGSLAHVYDEDFRAAVQLLGDGRVDAERIFSHRAALERVLEDETLKIAVRP
jgi:NADPH:quinone reductase-like Zn-dependent oxidoreductase